MTTPAEPRPDMDALLGAYVLDALEPDERESVERYLDANSSARAEVDELRETAAALATAAPADTTAPAELWQRIATEVDNIDSGDVDGGDDDSGDDELAERRARRTSRTRWILSGVAAVATAAAIVLAVVAIALHDDLDEARQPGDAQMAAAYERALEVDGARTAELSSDRGDARVVLLPDGTGYLVTDKLQPLDDSQTYQLWAVMQDGNEQRIISAGVLGTDPGAAGFTVDGPVAAFAMTVERAGGVPQTQQTPIATGTLT